MKLVDRIAQQISSDLQGTCNGYPDEQSLLGALLNLDKISGETYRNPNVDKLEKMFRRRESLFLAEVDQELFLCDQCGWWCATEEMSDHEMLICQDCYG